MLETLISSKTRIKLLLKFFLNPSNTAHLRGLESEFGESSNSIRLELNKMEEAGMLESQSVSNKKVFKANRRHPLFSEIHNLVLKHVGIANIVEDVVRKLGDIEKVYLVGDYAKGNGKNIIELVMIADNVDIEYLNVLTQKAENLLKKTIKFEILNTKNMADFEANLQKEAAFLVWNK